MNKFSLNFLVKIQSSFTYIKIFNYESFKLNLILLIRSGDVELDGTPKKSSLLTFFHWNLNEIAVYDHCPIILIEYFYLKLI